VEVDLDDLYPAMEQAVLALGQLNGVVHLVPNVSLFLYMCVRQEAVLSSQIEGTQSSLNDLLLFENAQKPSVSLDDVEEVSNYVRALNYGLERIRGGFPLSLRLLREIHGILLRGTRGKNQLPGEFRRSQNWIEGSRPGNAFFVPPAPEEMLPALDNLEKYWHDGSVPLLIRAGVAHAQFETIHPFLDGNGRVGRLLITLMLCNFGMLPEPILYPSLHFKQNRGVYYSLLNRVREKGDWEEWLKFFLEGVSTAAHGALQTIGTADALFAECADKIAKLGRGRFSAAAAFECLKKVPQISAKTLAREAKLTPPTARAALKALESMGVLEEVHPQRRGKTYIFRKYLDLLM
jgi:Fic family protein